MKEKAKVYYMTVLGINDCDLPPDGSYKNWSMHIWTDRNLAITHCKNNCKETGKKAFVMACVTVGRVGGPLPIEGVFTPATSISGFFDTEEETDGKTGTT